MGFEVQHSESESKGSYFIKEEDAKIAEITSKPQQP